MTEITLQKSKDLARGERLILVDGIAWAQTVISYHGVWGTKHAFRQVGGDVIGETSKHGYFHADTVRSERKRLWQESQWRPTEEKVLEKARELIEAGRLKHPDIVKAERDEAARHYRTKRAEQKRVEEAEFDAKAREALRLNYDGPSEIVDRVVAAMRWAQTK